MGFSVLPPFRAFGVQGHGYAYEDQDRFAQRLEGLKDAWAQRFQSVDRTQPLVFPGWDDWDEEGRYTAGGSERLAAQ